MAKKIKTNYDDGGGVDFGGDFGGGDLDPIDTSWAQYATSESGAPTGDVSGLGGGAGNISTDVNSAMPTSVTANYNPEDQKSSGASTSALSSALKALGLGGGNTSNTAVLGALTGLLSAYGTAKNTQAKGTLPTLPVLPGSGPATGYGPAGGYNFANYHGATAATPGVGYAPVAQAAPKPASSYYTYGQGPQQQQFQQVNGGAPITPISQADGGHIAMARGGHVSKYGEGGTILSGLGDLVSKYGSKAASAVKNAAQYASDVHSGLEHNNSMSTAWMDREDALRDALSNKLGYKPGDSGLDQLANPFPGGINALSPGGYAMGGPVNPMQPPQPVALSGIQGALPQSSAMSGAPQPPQLGQPPAGATGGMGMPQQQPQRPMTPQMPQMPRPQAPQAPAMPQSIMAQRMAQARQPGMRMAEGGIVNPMTPNTAQVAGPTMVQSQGAVQGGAGLAQRLPGFHRGVPATGHSPGLAEGGALSTANPQSGVSRHITGPGDGTSDSIPARLANGEYVIDAQAVSMLGNGDNSAGAKRLDEFRKNLRQHKGGALAKGKMAPDAKPVHKYMGGN
jgi:hypothetical protein